jgi:hypothetical protein
LRTLTASRSTQEQDDAAPRQIRLSIGRRHCLLTVDRKFISGSIDIGRAVRLVRSGPPRGIVEPIEIVGELNFHLEVSLGNRIGVE